MITSKGRVPMMTIRTPMNNGVSLFLNLCIMFFQKKKQTMIDVVYVTSGTSATLRGVGYSGVASYPNT